MSIDVSVIIPTFRREDGLREAIASVLAVKSMNLEIIAADDSPEGSAERVIKDFADPRLKYMRRTRPTGGRPATVRNEAVPLTSGRILYFLDDDDRVIGPNFAAALEALTKSEADVLISTPQPFGGAEEAVAAEAAYFKQALAPLQRHPAGHKLVEQLLFGDTFLVCSSCLITREAFEKLGGFDPEIPVCEDVEFYMRALREQDYLYFAPPVLERRIGQESLMASALNTNKMHQSYQLIYAKYRRRYGGLDFSRRWLGAKLKKLWSRFYAH